MSVRKRTWKNPRGEVKTVFVVDFFDHGGKRRHESFATEREAKRRHAQIILDTSKGKLVADDITVKRASELWLDDLKADGRERSTRAQYEQHLRLHILPTLGKVKLGKLNHETLKSFRTFLLTAEKNGERERSHSLAAKVWVTFKSILKAHRMGHVGSDVKGIGVDKRDKRRLEIGVDVPTNDEMKRLGIATEGDRPGHKRKRALLFVAAFCGLRASELRGLRWDDVKFDDGELQVTQRADRYGEIGNPKTGASRRTIPLPEPVARALREWKLAQPGSPELVFATKRGTIESHGNMLRSLWPVLRDARVLDENGEAKYALHAFRHYFASWCISPKDRGGRGLSPKVAQEWLGHSTIAMTLDVYGHLFKEVDKDEVSTAVKSVLG